ncbi:AzlC family ABC transporter permease [Rhodobacteraceae bacterium B1Z28]|uniref:AzlC family ABC transporter permease n=1 Tax=Ruegeria haliotis TaxID=2747601 RepID=A0ABX2PYC0_9RHOB|nr:AzlC family ABC transporter permease [Ruegeria haliotis]NVO58681.1 AzlC family ABC transporter permease [Ruegeria haliotis]
MKSNLTLVMVRIIAPNIPPKSRQITLSWRGIMRGVLRLTPMSIFVIPFGVGFGIAAIEQGLTVLQAMVLSVSVFSGAAQFAALEFWPKPVDLVSIALVMFAVNARHIVIGAALSPWLNQLPLWARWSALSLLSDPNFADSRPAFQSGERDAGILLGGGLILWLNWVCGTALGALAGAKIGDLQAYGFDVVMVCFFAAAITGQLKQRSTIVPAILAFGIAVATLGWLPTGWNIIVAALVGGIWGVLASAD